MFRGIANRFGGRKKINKGTLEAIGQAYSVLNSEGVEGIDVTIKGPKIKTRKLKGTTSELAIEALRDTLGRELDHGSDRYFTGDRTVYKGRGTVVTYLSVGVGEVMKNKAATAAKREGAKRDQPVPVKSFPTYTAEIVITATEQAASAEPVAAGTGGAG